MSFNAKMKHGMRSGKHEGSGRSVCGLHLIEEGLASERVVFIAEKSVLDLALPFWWSLIAGAQVFRVACIW